VLVDALGVPVRPEAYLDHFSVLCRTVEALEERHYSVRHTLALMMHRTGIPPGDASALLGHTVEVHYATYVPRTENGTRYAATQALEPRWPGSCEILVKLREIRGLPSRWRLALP
jgi:hypothetical protein